MALTSEEQRRWHELELQLSAERRLVALDSQLTHGSPTDAVLPMHTCVLWGLGACSGLIVVLIGGMMHNERMVTIGVGVLIATLVLVGIALLISGISSIRRTAGG